MLRRRSSFFPLVPEISELPCLQTSPSSGRRRTFKYRESAYHHHYHHHYHPLSPLKFIARSLLARTRLTHFLSRDFQTIFPAIPIREGRELQGSFLSQPRPFILHLSPALFPSCLCATSLLPAGARSACRRGVRARAPSPCCALVSPWARAGLCVHGTQSRGPSRGDGGDGESRGWPDGRETPYLP